METRTIKQGPRGGRYYVNSSGNRTYVNRSTLYIFQKINSPGRFFDAVAHSYQEAFQLLIDSGEGENLNEWRLWR